MSRWRILTVVALLGAPSVALACLGSYYLYREGLWIRVWWPMAASFILGYVLAWYWQRQRRLLRPVDFTTPTHWTDRDLRAWKLVEARAEAAGRIQPDRFLEIPFYVSTAQDLALELARFYHPGARDPIGSLTIPEILAVVELAAHDLGRLVDDYLPGGHLLTINNWRQAKQATDWYSTLSKAYWAVAAVFSPVKTGLRWAASQAGMTLPWQMLQENLLLWFYTAYLHRLGSYLIDLNSGRLRVGATRYRELLAAAEAPAPAAPAPVAPPAATADGAAVGQVTVTVMGQVKAGKSSLINALLGERRALTDVLPATAEVTRYQLQPEGIPTRLVLLDTVGYGHEGPREDLLRATEEAAQESDLVLLVVHARNPARQADLEMLEKLRQWFLARQHLKMPPVLGVMTHIDLLSPALEWAPPYDWEQPRRPKEQQIREAWNALRQQLGDYLVGIVPLCTAPGKVYGVEEWFLPTLVELLDEAHAVGLLRCLRAEADLNKVRRVFQQLLAAGKQVAQVILETYRK
jgi:predicted GTPase